jgi:repressor LexA
MEALTSAQSRILDAVAQFARRGQLATVPELVRALGLARESGLTPTLDAIARKGFLSVEGGGRGGVRYVALTEPGEIASGLAFPLLGEIPAGPLQEAREEWLDVLRIGDALRTHPGDFFLKVRGHSMKDAGILPGDCVLLRPGVQAANGEICACLIEQDDGSRQATLKKLHLRGSQAHLKAANPAVETLIVPAQSVLVAGVFRGLVRRG